MNLPATVIFDTNAYRTLTYKKNLVEAKKVAKELGEREAAAGVMAVAHPIVIWELLAHLEDPQESDFENCLNSVVALGEHTRLPGKSEGIQLIGDSYSTLSRTLFNQLPKGYETGVLAMGTFVSHVVQHVPDLSDSTFQSRISQMSTGMAKQENAWLQSMKLITEQFCPGAMGAITGEANDKEARAKAHAFFSSPKFFEIWSTVIVLLAATSIETVLTREVIEEKAKFVRENFATPYQLFQALILKLSSSSPPALDNPKKKRWNFVWDSMISFSVRPGIVNENPVYLISGDGAIVDAAKEAGFGDQVKGIAEYKRELSSP